MHSIHRLVPSLTLAALVLALGACGPEPIDPLTEPVAFSFEVANPEEITGPVFGAMVVPFEPNPMFGMRTSAPAEVNLDAFVDVMLDTEIAEAGLVAGSLISVYDVPRINESPNHKALWWAFYPPEGCPMTATNPTEATLAPLFGMAVWDGESFVGEDPDVDGMIFLETYERVDGEGGAYTDTFARYVLVASRATWSASTDGPCAPEESSTVTLAVDLAIDAGWQFLRYTSVQTYDGLDWTYAEELVSLTLDQVAAAGIIGEAVPPDAMLPVSLSAASAQAGLSLLFR